MKEEQKIFICECNSLCHQAMFWSDDDDSLYIVIHLTTHKNFFKRFWTGLKYAFGYKSNFGDWDEFLFKPEDKNKLINYLKK